MLKNVRVLDSTGSNNNITSAKTTTVNKNTGTYQSTSFTSALSNAITSAVNTATKAQNATMSKVSSLTSSSSSKSTTTKTPVVTRVDYSGEIQKVRDAITKFNNADSYLKKALEYLSSSLVINGSNPFSSTVNNVKSSNLTELSKLTNEILPEMK